MADKGYASQKNREYLREMKHKDGIMRKRALGREFTVWEKLRNRLISSKRFIVEQLFGTLKRRFLFNRASYKTRRKVEDPLCFKAICMNLLKALRKIRVLPEIV